MDSVEIHKDPFGVVLIIGAWNYPLQLTLLPVAGAIAGGNCVVIKPSEVSPASAKFIAETIPKYLDNVSFVLDILMTNTPSTNPSPSPQQNFIIYLLGRHVYMNDAILSVCDFRIVFMWFAAVLKKRLNC